MFVSQNMSKRIARSRVTLVRILASGSPTISFLSSFTLFHAGVMVTSALISIWILILAYVDAAQVSLRRANSECRPFQSSFSAHDISRSGGAPFQVVSPEGSVSAEDNNLKLYLDKPRGAIRTKHGMNDVVAEGATVNSTFVTLYVSSVSPSRAC